MKCVQAIIALVVAVTLSSTGVNSAAAETPVRVTNPAAGLVCTATVIFSEEEHTLLAYVFTIEGPRGTVTLVFRHTSAATMPAVLVGEVIVGTGPPLVQPFGPQPAAVFGTVGTFEPGPGGRLEPSAGLHPFLVGVDIQEVLRSVATDFCQEAVDPSLLLTGSPSEGTPVQQPGGGQSPVNR